MNILNIFTFKKDFKEFFSKETIADLFDYAKEQIIHYIEKSDLFGFEKKQRVDEAVILYIDMRFNSKNSIVRFVTELIKSIIPAVTQSIYDYLKSYIEGLTKKAKNV